MNKIVPKKILAIETSCDETAAAVLLLGEQDKNFPKITTMSAVVKSQVGLHKKMGGVVPEVSARAHVKNILPVTEKALQDAKLNIQNIDYLAVTAGPGLIPSLIVGVEFAKALALAAKKPVIPVNHMAGHLYSPAKQVRDLKLKFGQVFPQIALIVSGGHTMLVLMKNTKDYAVLGQTVDDAAGEAFDKVAKLLKLPYPGGPEVSRLAEKAAPAGRQIVFPRPMIHSKDYNFSFSGLKTAVLYYLRDHPQTAAADICRAFQDAAVDVLVSKTLRAAKEFKAKSISLSGGVAANQALRHELSAKSKKLSLNFFVPPINLCTDNAEMIGLAAAFMLKRGFKPKSYSAIQANPNLQL